MNEFIVELSNYVTGNPLIAFGAVALGGMLTSANPCVLITLPLIIGFTGGYAQPGVKRALSFSLVFVLGLSFSFTLLGLLAALAGRLLGDIGGLWNYLIAGVVIIMGLQLVGLFEIPMPSRPGRSERPPTLIGAFLLGMISGLISSPCATPILAVILTYVASEGNVLYGGALLFVYAVGHSILLLIAGVSTGAARWLVESKSVKTGSVWIRKTTGVLLVIAG
ncbi:cytochrome c biogenesis CcdA family protein, partial [Gemmatimonadota bacterium]